MSERCLDGIDRHSVPFDGVVLDYALADPAAQVGKQARRDGHGRLALIRGSLSFGKPIEFQCQRDMKFSISLEAIWGATRFSA